jgi:hypothetical protein
VGGGRGRGSGLGGGAEWKGELASGDYFISSKEMLLQKVCTVLKLLKTGRKETKIFGKSAKIYGKKHVMISI